MKNLFTPEENMIFTKDYYIKEIEEMNTMFKKHMKSHKQSVKLCRTERGKGKQEGSAMALQAVTEIIDEKIKKWKED